MKLAFILPILLLWGCAHKISVKPAEHLTPVFQSPKPVQQEKYQWVVVTKDNLDAVTKNGGVLIALTPQGYKAINGNQAELRRYIKDQEVLIGAYKAYVASDKNK